MQYSNVSQLIKFDEKAAFFITFQTTRNKLDWNQISVNCVRVCNKNSVTSCVSKLNFGFDSSQSLVISKLPQKLLFKSGQK